MAHTVAQCLAHRGAELAYVLEVEGYDRAFTTTSDSAGVAAAWTGWTTFSKGLELPGSLTRKWDVLGFALDVPSLTLQLVDTDGAAATMFATEKYAHLTNLALDLDRDDTTITVASTAGFAASGTIYIGAERITYTGTTATEFTGCTRGTFAHGGKASWSHSFLLGANGYGAEVTDHPRVWKGRGVTVYITAKDPDTGTWIAKASAVTWFSGFIAGYSYDASSGRWTISCDDVASAMRAEVLRDQFTAKIESFYVPASLIQIKEDGTSAVNVNVTAGLYSCDTLIEHLNTQLSSAGLTNQWTFTKELTPDGVRVRLTMTAAGASTCLVYTRQGVTNLSGAIIWAEMLGFVGDNDVWTLQTSSTERTTFTMGSSAPVRAAWDPRQPTLTVGTISGAWHNQSPDDLGGDPAGDPFGFIRIGESDVIWRVTWDEATKTFAREVPYNFDLTPKSFGSYGAWDEEHTRVTYDDDQSKLVGVKQVWCAKLPLHALLGRLLLSTGTTDYNDSTYDKWPAEQSAGLPSTLVDTDGLRVLNNLVAARICFVITEPTSINEIVNSLQSSFGFALAWKDGELTPRVPLTLEDKTAEWTINSAVVVGYPDAGDGSEYIRNRLILSYNRTPDGDYEATETYDHLPSQSESGVVTFEVPGDFIRDTTGLGMARVWREAVAVPILAYFARGIARIDVTCARPIAGIACGDVASLTIEDIPNPTTGTYGITAEPAWVVSVTADPLNGSQQRIELLVPRFNAEPLGSSAMLDYTREDKGYDSENWELYLLPHEFSTADEAEDGASFPGNSKIRIIEADVASGAAPVTHLTTCLGYNPTDNTLALGDEWTTFDNTKRYYVEFDDYATQNTSGVASALAHVHLADDGDRLVQDLVAPFSYAAGLPAASGDTPDATFLYRRLADLSDDEGEPLSVAKVRDAAGAANNLKAHVANQQPVSRLCSANRAITGTTYGLVALLPIRVPIGAASLSVRVWGSVAAGTGTFRVSVCSTKPSGAVAAPTFADDYTTVTGTTTSTSIAAIDVTATLPGVPGDRTLWVVIEAKNSGANATNFRGVTAFVNALALT